MRHAFAFSLSLVALSLFTSPATAEQVLLEDYESGGAFAPADWANTFSDADGNTNSAYDDGKFALVEWATKWSGIPSTNYEESIDCTKYKTFQFDVMVEKGQPVEENSNFYCQLLYETGDEGYAYWEIFVPQKSIPADGKWHRVRVPIKKMVPGFGDGAKKPTDRKNIMGCCVGMTFDDENEDKFKFKRAFFDNVVLDTEEVDETKVASAPKTVNPPKKQK